METGLTLIPSIPIFFIGFLTIYFITYFVVFQNWTPNFLPEAASCAISLAHDTPAAVLAIYAILSDTSPIFGSTNTLLQNLVLDYNISNFLMDLCHYLIFYPSDVMLICHHLATFFASITYRYLVGHCAYVVLILLILLEVTSFCQNTWTLANARIWDSAIAAKVYVFLSPLFHKIPRKTKSEQKTYPAQLKSPKQSKE